MRHPFYLMKQSELFVLQSCEGRVCTYFVNLVQSKDNSVMQFPISSVPEHVNLDNNIINVQCYSLLTRVLLKHNKAK